MYVLSRFEIISAHDWFLIVLTAILRAWCRYKGSLFYINGSKDMSRTGDITYKTNNTKKNVSKMKTL